MNFVWGRGILVSNVLRSGAFYTVFPCRTVRRDVTALDWLDPIRAHRVPSRLRRAGAPKDIVMPFGPVSGQRFSVQREQTAPCLFSLRLVVDARVRRAPSVRRAAVDLDFRRQVRLGECL